VQQNKVGEPKLFKLFGHFSLALIIGATSVYGSSFEDFRKSQTEAFAQYKDERDNAFNSYLKQQWSAYKVYQGKKRYETPKPKKLPHTQQTKSKSVGPKVIIRVKKVIEPKPPVIQEVLKPVVKVINKPKQHIVKKKVSGVYDFDVKINYFGTELGFNIPTKIKEATFYPQNQKGIANYFNSAASSDYNDFIDSISTVKKAMKLNDWGLYLLVNKLTKKAYKDKDSSKLLSWFIFNKLGYAVKLGLAQNHIVLMYYSKKTIYSTPNYNFGKRKYYVLSNYAKGNIGRLYSYKQDYPGSTKALNLSLDYLPKLALDIRSKDLRFRYFGNSYNIPYKYNQNLVDFMGTYPQADYQTFFDAPLDPITYMTLSTGIKKYIDGEKMGDAMNFLLHFVQKSFKYETDAKQFNREKVMFAQETLYYSKSDCEDRAILFSYLINELFKVSVVGVHYKGHMATALYVPMRGDYIHDGSRKFVVADPTYINSNIGQAMPQFRRVKPKSLIKVDIK